MIFSFTISLTNQTKCFCMKVKLLLLCYVPLLLLISSLDAAAQDRTINGTITNKSGQPLSGATISVKGTTTATATDNNGNFSLNVPDGARTLTISYIGYANQDVNIPSSGAIAIQLDETAAADLNEVIVVGYGVQRKSVVTGAISSVRASDLENQPVTRIEQSLQGRT